jgi:hypothetical protein
MALVNAFGNPLIVEPSNVVNEFREFFETYDTTNTWTQVTGSGDLIQLDGNTAAANYLVISKDPLTAGTESSITTVASFDCPIELVSGHSMSQRGLGQELSMELFSSDGSVSTVADVAIASISQTTTTLTVTTSAAHGLQAGARIGIIGITSDSRLNYPALVVAAVVNTTSFTATAGPAGTIPSLTVGPYTSQGSVYYRPALGYARDGISEVFETGSATTASVYVRADSGDSLPSGTITGAHPITVSNTASVQAVAAAYAYAFQPTSEYRVLLTPDRLQVYDTTVDSIGSFSSRINRSQIVPDNTKTYKLRYRFTNVKGLTVPSAKIVSSAKSASTTATITTAAAHGLTTGDYIVVYGNRDQTNFANLTTATVVASVINSTSFTIAYGASTTATTYGGMVAKVQGANIPAAFSAIAIQSATNSGTELALVGNTTWTVVAGDYVNVYGCRVDTTGVDLGVDGVYKVANVATTTLTLIPIGGTVLPSSFASTNCGGTVIKRTDARISFARAFNFTRDRVEILAKPATDQQAAASVYLVGGTIGSGTIGTVTTVTTVSTSLNGINVLTNDVTSAALTSTATATAITPASGALSQEFNVIVTAVSGTTPTLDVVVQESDDTGTNWFDIYHFPRITATGQYRSPLIPFVGNRIRYVRTVGGTTPSFTNAVNRIASQTSNPMQRQFIDRALVINTISSVTATWFIEGCKTLNFFVSMGAVTTTAPVLVLEVSPDGTNWVQTGADVTTAASTNNQLTVTDTISRFARIRVKTAGSGATLNFLMLKGAGL